jgi:ferredoxin-NADP reductase
MGETSGVILPEFLVVRSIDSESTSVKSVVLTEPGGAPLPPWTPGAHIEIEFSNGLIRQYSLCGEVADSTSWRIAVLREPSGRGGSRYVHDDLVHGEIVRLRRLRNLFPFEPAGHQIFVAGGIGITPILPMIRQCVDGGHGYSLYYCGQTLETMAFVEELPQSDSVHVVVTGADGLLDIDGALDESPTGATVYCCGPAGLIKGTQASAEVRGLTVHFERFSASGAAAQSGASTERSFEVMLAKSGGKYRVPPTLSILDVLEEYEVAVDSSCRDGTCGTCETVVLRGDIDHRDELLDDAERKRGDKMMICVSRSLSDSLTLDL